MPAPVTPTLLIMDHGGRDYADQATGANPGSVNLPVVSGSNPIICRRVPASGIPSADQD